ncbi:MAG: glycosyltransferase [Armatimonadetes bacterium]|nr:glycosyltransferase [Armatimonadota bacterium]
MKLLLVLNQLLYPADTGGKIRSSSMFERVAREHDVTVVGLARPTDTDEQVNQMGRVCRRLDLVPWREVTKRSPRFWLDLLRNQVQPYPYMVARYHHPALARRVAELVEQLRPDVVVCDFLQPSLNVLDLPFRPKVLFQHNVEAQIGQRHYEKAANPLARAFWGSQWRKLKAYEGSAMKRFDHVVTVSEADNALMASEYGVTHTTAVPLGVDTDAFVPATEPPIPGRLVFTGSMDWLPNEDGMAWFVGEVLPRIRASRPEVTLSIVGRNPTPKVRWSLAAWPTSSRMCARPRQ